MKYRVEVESFDGNGFEIGGHVKEFDQGDVAITYAFKQIAEPGWNSVMVFDPTELKLIDHRFYNTDKWGQHILLSTEEMFNDDHLSTEEPA